MFAKGGQSFLNKKSLIRGGTMDKKFAQSVAEQATKQNDCRKAYNKASREIVRLHDSDAIRTSGGKQGYGFSWSWWDYGDNDWRG